MERLKYISSESFMEGIITEVHAGSVTIDFRGRMGRMQLPLRMLITDFQLEPGQSVGWIMSYPEVLGPDIDQNYQSVQENQRKAKSHE